jgi:hypothetical protein
MPVAANAGHDLAFRQMPVANQALASIIGDKICMTAEKPLLEGVRARPLFYVTGFLLNVRWAATSTPRTFRWRLR